MFLVQLYLGMSPCSKHTCVHVSGSAGFGYDRRERVLALESGAAESGQGVCLVACAHGIGRQQQEEMITMATTSNKGCCNVTFWLERYWKFKQISTNQCRLKIGLLIKRLVNIINNLCICVLFLF